MKNKYSVFYFNLQYDSLKNASSTSFVKLNLMMIFEANAGISRTSDKTPETNKKTHQ